MVSLGKHHPDSHIVSFDLDTDLFFYRELRDFGMDDNSLIDDIDPDVGMRLLVLFHGSPAVFCITACDIAVWVMRENAWTKECRVGSPPELSYYLLEKALRIWYVIFSEKSNELLLLMLQNGLVPH